MQVGDTQPLLLVEIAAVDDLGLFRASTIAVDAWFFVPAGASGAPVAPSLAGPLAHADRVRGRRVVHATVDQPDVMIPSGPQHRFPFRIPFPVVLACHHATPQSTSECCNDH